MDRVRDIFLYFVAALAMFALMCSVYQAMNDKNRSALTLGAIFLVSALIVFIPKLDVLEAWGIKAVLNKTLDRAEEIIGRLQRLSAISARTSYMTIAWGNRMGTPSAKEKQAVLDDVDKQLAELNVSAHEREQMTRPYVQLIGFDFYLLYTRMLDRYLSWKSNEILKKNAQNSTDESRATAQDFLAKQNEWRSAALGNDVFSRLDTYKFADELKRATPTAWLESSEHRAVEQLNTRLTRLFEEIKQKGGYTIEAAEFYDRYHDLGGHDLLIKELFGVNPSEVR